MRINHRGDFKNTERFLKQATKITPLRILNKYGAKGVAALASATPKDTGETASSWSYEVKKGQNNYTIVWSNSHIAGQVPVVILIQYGHATGNGGYVRGRDFINPSMRPIFDTLAEEVWKEVTRL